MVYQEVIMDMRKKILQSLDDACWVTLIELQRVWVLSGLYPLQISKKELHMQFLKLV